MGNSDKQIDTYLAEHGYHSLEEISGVVQKFLPEKDEKKPYQMGYDLEKCNHCGRCIKVCPYHARTFGPDKTMVIDEKECRKCGLCVSICGCLSV